MKKINDKVIKLNIGNVPYAKFDNIEVIKNSINIIMGKNNIGKTNILKGINNNNKNFHQTHILLLRICLKI